MVKESEDFVLIKIGAAFLRCNDVKFSLTQICLRPSLIRYNYHKSNRLFYNRTTQRNDERVQENNQVVTRAFRVARTRASFAPNPLKISNGKLLLGKRKEREKSKIIFFLLMDVSQIKDTLFL